MNILDTPVTTFVHSSAGRHLSSKRILYHLPERLEGYDPAAHACMQTSCPPISVALCPTSLCVRRCSFCSNTSRNEAHRKGAIQWADQTFDAIATDLVNLNVQGVSLAGGGEPLAYSASALASFLVRADLPFRIGIHTNGVLLERVATTSVLETGNVAYINISAVAHDPILYQSVCKAPQEQFRVIERNLINALQLQRQMASRTAIGVKMLICRENYSHTADMFRYFRALGIDDILIRCVANFEEHQDVELSESELNTLIPMLKADLGMEDNQISAITGRNPEFASLPRPSRCWVTALQCTAGIDPDGEVYLCSPWSRKEYSVGNVNELPFGSIWGSTRHKEVADALNALLAAGRCDPLRCRHYYSNLAVDAFIAGLQPPLLITDVDKTYIRFI